MAPDASPAGTVDTVADTVADTVPNASSTPRPTTDGDDTVAPARVAPAFPLVTPVGPDGLAITTHAACTSCTRGSMSATLPSGSVVGVQVIDPDGRFVVVSLPADAGYSAMSVADASRAPASMSVMYEGVYTPIDPDSAGALCTPEAAPVLDDHGQLVGLCTASDDGASIVPVDSLPPLPAASTPATERGDHDDRVVHDHARHDHDGGADDGGAGHGRRRLSTASGGASGGCRAPRPRGPPPRRRPSRRATAPGVASA